MKKSWQERLLEQEAENKVSLGICLAGLIHYESVMGVIPRRSLNFVTTSSTLSTSPTRFCCFLVVIAPVKSYVLFISV